MTTSSPSLPNRMLTRYFGASPAPTVNDVRQDMWSPAADDPYSALPSVSYSSALLEQYKIYVEMADRISARRGLANTFFLTLNSAIFTAIGGFWSVRPHPKAWVLVFPALVLIAQCLAWFWIVRSYRQLNAAKYAVVGAFEERLPASPYWRAEWKALGEGKDPSRYWPLTHLEQWIPILFATSYLGAFLAVLLT